MSKKKLITNPDGTLSYPHSFKVGDLVEFLPGSPYVKAYGNGIGIITWLENDKLKIFWQSNQKYMDYTVASAVLTLKIVST